MERSWSPIPGYCGHVPGRRWEVGKAVPNKLHSRPLANSDEVTERLEINPDRGEKQLLATSALDLREASPRSEDFNASFISESTQTDESGNKEPPVRVNVVSGMEERVNERRGELPQRSEVRSKSVPRKLKPRRADGVDVFAGLESGWWSQSDAIRNRERQHRVVSDNGTSTAAEEHAKRASAKITVTGGRGNDDDQIPCAGYSGHLPRFRQHDVGKSFFAAARESRRDRFGHSARPSRAIRTTVHQ